MADDVKTGPPCQSPSLTSHRPPCWSRPISSETLIVFAVFPVTFPGAKPTMHHAVGFALISAGAWFVFHGPL